ncbi:MAG: acetyl ornithine aminotransferase family protein [Anaerolineales bacterium]|nr:MAG: acetyl ornithine aminotransferase family protein [Anaerolineales bacterium]
MSTLATQERLLTLPGPKAREIVERDANSISPSYARVYPFVMSHGRGSEVWDVDGNRFIDFTAGISVTATGHCHPQVVQAIKDAADKFIHISSDFYHKSMIELAEKLDEIVPIQEHCQTFLTNSGTESVEGAIKLARRATGRMRFIGFIGGFHGRTLGSLAFTASKHTQQEGFSPAMPGVVHIPFPNPYRPLLVGDDQGLAVLDYLENVVFQSFVPPHAVAAVLLEPIQGEGGYIVPPDSFIPGLRRLCDKYGILLIADEVQSGIGRTGKWFAMEHWGVEPDIVLSAKGIASGMPIGAFIARESLMDHWGRGAHGNTYGGNPLCTAAALATLRLVEDGMMENAARMGHVMQQKVRDMMDRHPSIGHVRGKGLMVGMELVMDQATKEPARQILKDLLQTAFERGLLLLPCGVSTIRFMPPLNVSEEIVEEGLYLFDQALTAAEEKSLGGRNGR